MTNIKTITTSKAELLVCEVPEDFEMAGIVNSSLYYYSAPCFRSMDDYPYSIPLPKGNYQFINTCKDITEEECKEIVEANHNLKYGDRNDMTGYRDYGELHKDGKPYWFGNSLDSFKSLLIANDIWIENPLGERAFNCGAGQWQEHQQKVKNYVILKKI